jgi:hypothetical protein
MKRAGTCARNTPAIRAFLVQNMPPEWSGTFLKHHFLDPIRILKILIYSLFKPFVLCPKVIKSKNESKSQLMHHYVLYPLSCAQR